MSARIAQLVDTIGQSLLQLRDEFSDPSLLSFHDVAKDMEKFEAYINAKALIDASFAYLCDRDDAGRTVGAKYPNAYLQNRLGLSPGEAYDRLARGKDLFAPPPASPEPDPAEASSEPDFDLFNSGDAFTDPADDPEAAAAAAAAAEEARRHAEEERLRDQEEARNNASEVPAEKQNVIRRELDKLLAPARGERSRIHALAMKEALTRDVNDLRYFVRRHVDEANRTHAPRSNPNAGYDNRALHLGKRRNADGTYTFNGVATAAHMALFKALLDKGAAPNTNMGPDDTDGTDGSDGTDTRRPEQRRFDQFVTILESYEANQQKLSGGAASVVVSMTIDDLIDADGTTAAGATFTTNTGIELNVTDMVRLGLGRLDNTDSTEDGSAAGPANFILQLDSVTGVPLSMGRTRCASIPQRIAMLAVQGVCSWAGCTKPITETEAHHIIAFILGGKTEMDNLTGLCREHHRRNNDNRDGTFGQSHMDYDPATGRAGLVRPGADHMEFNQSEPAATSAANRIRHRNGQACPPTAPTGKHRPTPTADPALFPPGPPRTRQRRRTHTRE